MHKYGRIGREAIPDSELLEELSLCYTLSLHLQHYTVLMKTHPSLYQVGPFTQENDKRHDAMYNHSGKTYSRSMLTPPKSK